MKSCFSSCNLYGTEKILHPALVLTLIIVLTAALSYTSYVGLKLFKKCDLSDITPEWLESFSVETYRPMQGLLAAEDFAFLSAQPGFDLSLHRKLRRERLHIFRQYLNCLVTDFNKLHAVARLVLAESESDNSELVGRLIRLKLTFGVYVLQVELSYLLYMCGLQTIRVQALLRNLELMNLQLIEISGPQAA